MTSVEVYWQKIAAAAGDSRKWENLTKAEQEMIVYSVNIVLSVLNNNR